MPFKELHEKAFFTAIEKHFDIASPSDFIESNNSILMDYLESVSEDEDVCRKHVKNMVFMMSLQNKFIAELYENYNRLKSNFIAKAS